MNTAADKIVFLEQLIELRHRWRAESLRIVWTNGAFDLLHVGHLASLEAASMEGHVLVVGVNSDRVVRALKGPLRPIIPEDQRALMVAAVWCVDYVLIYDDELPSAILSRLHPHVHCKGRDYAPPDGKPIPEMSIVQSYGGRVAFLSLVPDVSTSAIVSRVVSGAPEP
jgi:rfaE bifunctional protein nucleotidyltransferase chain/domain